MTSTASRISRGAGWLYTYRWLDRLLEFVAVVVLARILAPEDFGLFAIAASVVAIVEGLSEFDVSRALIRERDEHPILYDTAWTLAVLRGLVSGLVMVLVAPVVPDPRIGAMVAALALSPVLAGLSNPRFVMFERGLVYSRLAGLTLAARLVSFGVTLYVAVVYESYWALALGVLGHTATSLVLSYAFKPYRPTFTLARARELLAFSGWMSLTAMVTTLSMKTDRIIVGRLAGIGDAGAYFMTQRVGVVPTAELVSPLQRILFPSFSEIARDRPKLRRSVAESVNVLASLSVPAGIGFALVANDFVPLMLGETWVVIVPLLKVLVPFLGFRATLSMTLPCVMALGHTRMLFGVSVLYAVVHLPVFIVATALFGLPGSIWGIVAAGVFYTYLNAWMLRRSVGLSLAEMVRPLRRPLLASVAMVGAVGLASSVAPIDLFSSAGSWVSLVSKTTLGVVVVGLTHYALWVLEGRPAGIERRLHQLLSR